MSRNADIQSAFARALLDVEQPIPPTIRGASRRRADRRFAVYRNNVVAGLTTALAKRFPVVNRLVGDEFFRAMAKVYVTKCPPLSPIMMLYGETFPDFIDGFSPAKSVPYLGDVARIEIARGRAYHAEDAIPIAHETFTSVPAELLGELRVKIHPSMSIVSSTYPIVSIWQVNDDPARAAPIAPWAPEAALVARPSFDVEVRRLTLASATFLSCLQHGESLAQALEAGQASSPEFDIVDNLRTLMSSNVVTAIASLVPAAAGKHRKLRRRALRAPVAERREADLIFA